MQRFALLPLSFLFAVAAAADSPFNATLVSVVAVIAVALGAIFVVAIVLLVIWMRLKRIETPEFFSTQKAGNMSPLQNLTDVKKMEEAEEDETDFLAELTSFPPTAYEGFVTTSAPQRNSNDDWSDDDQYIVSEGDSKHSQAAESIAKSNSFIPHVPTTVSQDYSDGYSDDDRYVTSKVDSKDSKVAESTTKSNFSDPFVVPSTFHALKTDKKDEGQRSTPVHRAPPPVPPPKRAALTAPAAATVAAGGQNTGNLSMTELIQAIGKGKEDKKKQQQPLSTPVKVALTLPTQRKAREGGKDLEPAIIAARPCPVPSTKAEFHELQVVPPVASTLKPVPPVKPKPEDLDTVATVSKAKPVPPVKPKPEDLDTVVTVSKAKPVPPVKTKPEDLDTVVTVSKAKPVPPVKPKPEDLDTVVTVSKAKPVPPVKPKPEDLDTVVTVSKAKPVPPVKPKPEDLDTVVTVSKAKPVPPVKPKPEDLDTVVTVSKAKPVPPVKPKPEDLDTVVTERKLKSPPVKPTAIATNEGSKPQPPIKPKVDTVTTASIMKLVPLVKPIPSTTSDNSKPHPPAKPSFTLPPAESGGSLAHTKPKPRPAPRAPVAVEEVQERQPPSHPPKPVTKPRVSAKRVDEGGSVADGGKREETRVSVKKFGEHVASLHADYNDEFINQFDALPSSEGHLTTDGKLPANSLRNRTHNILPYNDNRIKLKPIPGLKEYQHNYINASYIDGLSIPHKYIATQGPSSETVIDFWRLVWQEKVPTIAMVTNLQEGPSKRSERYWPESGTADYGPYSVTLAEQQVLANYTLRTLELCFTARGGRAATPRSLLHLQFTSWPNQDTPPLAGSLLGYSRRLRALHDSDKGPLLVHCSEGVGCTGTLLAIQLALEQAVKEGYVDVPSIITRLRGQRMKMVQCQEQFIFIHDVVLEKLICGDTNIPTPDLRRTVEKLKQEELKDGHRKTGYAIQFDVLQQVSPKPEETICQVARQCPAKNRTMDYLPPDSDRVPLEWENPGYIHASFVNGYKEKNAFIIAQAPMESTCRDFWKMVFERKCGVIVMLSQLSEGGKEVCAQYWAEPEERQSWEFAEYTVCTLEEGSVPGYGYRTRRIAVTDSRTGKQHQVTQFQVPVWNADGTCSAPSTLIDVLHKVEAVQRKSRNRPIIVHGSDTVNRCGMLCALLNTIQCCKAEGGVDVFQAVKALRLQKPGSVPSLVQYQSLFSLMVAFLDSFDTYANFK